jgi:hypothetical protein
LHAEVSTFTTPETYSPGWSTLYLLGAIVSCGDAGLLTSMRLNSLYNPDGRYSFTYGCQVLATTSGRYTVTPDNTLGNNNIIYLDRHDADCGPGYLMNGYAYQPGAAAGDFRIFMHCSPRATVNCASYTTASSMDSRDFPNLNYLDRLPVSCPASTYLRGFRFASSGLSMSYIYQCCGIQSSVPVVKPVLAPTVKPVTKVPVVKPVTKVPVVKPVTKTPSVKPVAAPTATKIAAVTTYALWPCCCPDQPNYSPTCPSLECTEYSGCTYWGQTAAGDSFPLSYGTSGLNPFVSFFDKNLQGNGIDPVVAQTNWETNYKNKWVKGTITQGNGVVTFFDAQIKDTCGDGDCNGCCSNNAASAGTSFLIDFEYYTLNKLIPGSVTADGNNNLVGPVKASFNVYAK